MSDYETQRIAFLENDVERQETEIQDLRERLVEKGQAFQELDEYSAEELNRLDEKVLDAEGARDDAQSELDYVKLQIASVASDLEDLFSVPLQDLERSIGDLVELLREVA